jgi:hypothetical protein
METDNVTLVMIPKNVWEAVVNFQQVILHEIHEIKNQESPNVKIKNISAMEYMKAIGVKRTKFDQLVSENKIKIIKKRRKIYVPVTEVDRYFNDDTIE